LHIIIFQEEIFDGMSLGGKERDLELIRSKNTKIRRQKYISPKSEAWHSPCHLPGFPFAAFASRTSYLLVYFWPKSSWFLMEHSSDVFNRA